MSTFIVNAYISITCVISPNFKNSFIQMWHDCKYVVKYKTIDVHLLIFLLLNEYIEYILMYHRENSQRLRGCKVIHENKI